MMVMGDSSGGMYEITGLTSSTTYSIEVSAVNSNGTGPYSTPVVVNTLESKLKSTLVNFMIQLHCGSLGIFNIWYWIYEPV